MGAGSAKKPTIVGVADVERVIETAELDGDAAREPVLVLDEAEKTAEGDKPALTSLHYGKEKAVKDVEETDCAAQDASEDQHETVVLETAAKKPIMAEVAEETTAPPITAQTEHACIQLEGILVFE